MSEKKHRYLIGLFLLIFAWTSSCGEPIPVDCATEEECTTENEGGFQTGTGAGIAAGGAAVLALAGGAISGGGESSDGSGSSSSGGSSTGSGIGGTTTTVASLAASSLQSSLSDNGNFSSAQISTIIAGVNSQLSDDGYSSSDDPAEVFSSMITGAMEGIGNAAFADDNARLDAIDFVTATITSLLGDSSLSRSDIFTRSATALTDAEKESIIKKIVKNAVVALKDTGLSSDEFLAKGLGKVVGAVVVNLGAAKVTDLEGTLETVIDSGMEGLGALDVDGPTDFVSKLSSAATEGIFKLEKAGSTIDKSRALEKVSKTAVAGLQKHLNDGYTIALQTAINSALESSIDEQSAGDTTLATSLKGYVTTGLSAGIQCSFNGAAVNNGDFVTAYNQPNGSCSAVARECNYGVLSNSEYTYAECTSVSSSTSFYLSNETDFSIQNVFVSASEDDDWGNDKLILPTLGSSSIYIGEIECDQQLDFRVDFFPATIGEHKKYNYFNSCQNQSLTWTINSISQSRFEISSGELPPAIPSNLEAVAGAEQITISWNVVSNATSYTVFWNTVPTQSKYSNAVATDQMIDGLATSSFTHTGLDPGQSYYYRVAAFNQAGSRGLSSEASATLIPAEESEISVEEDVLEDTDASFSRVNTEILQAKCIVCYMDGSLAQNTPLVYVSTSTSTHELTNYNVVLNYFDAADGNKERFLQKAQGGAAHGGGAVINPASAEFKLLNEWINSLETEEETASAEVDLSLRKYSSHTVYSE
jgi:hypothetical protein